MIKGNVIVGQSGGPTSVINASLAGVFKTAKERGVKKVYGMLNGIQGLLERRYVDLSEQVASELDIELLKRTPSAFLGSCRYKLPDFHKDDQPYKAIFEILKELDIAYFFYNGGNDSMDTINKLCQYGKTIGSKTVFVGIPKTIDNDLTQTDHTPGYGSAAKYIATTTKEIIRDGLVYGNNAVTIIEIMGRNAGWLTAASALAKGEDCEGVDLMYLPEQVFDMDGFLKSVKDLSTQKKSIIVCVSEGIRVKNGKYVSELTDNAQFVDSFGHKSLTGTSRYLANFLANELNSKTRAIEFSTMQRCGAHIASETDVTEAFMAGGAAFNLAYEGGNGRMITFKRVCDQPYQCVTDSFEIAKIANAEKVIPNEWILPNGLGVTKEFIAYARPLIQGESAPIMANGMPRHLVLKR